ncbi:hypothetical protein OS493_039134 [Desmophyllum pertusum]|uniref:Uncharacterized protein n=1 Tax=Desmophyllum pertusum TaxID=174260 RepID=A0A9W9Y6U9_9CNID|nr:hypothetical protein OS493_039134 [Desmophyllum pertusum]
MPGLESLCCPNDTETVITREADQQTAIGDGGCIAAGGCISPHSLYNFATVV